MQEKQENKKGGYLYTLHGYFNINLCLAGVMQSALVLMKKGRKKNKELKERQKEDRMGRTLKEKEQ